jgi:hypothetical protein
MYQRVRGSISVAMVQHVLMRGHVREILPRSSLNVLRVSNKLKQYDCHASSCLAYSPCVPGGFGNTGLRS